MAQDRSLLQAKLVEVLGSSNVYFQPPENLKLQYPCIIYNWDYERQVRANNQQYKRDKRYQLMHITRDPVDSVVDKLSNLPMVKFSRAYTEDGLHHTIYDIYF